MNELLKIVLANKGKVSVGMYRAILLGGVLWLNQSFVSKEDYANDKKAQSEINTKVAGALTQINTTLTLMSRQDEWLRDLEQRVRVLESKTGK